MVDKGQFRNMVNDYAGAISDYDRAQRELAQLKKLESPSGEQKALMDKIEFRLMNMSSNIWYAKDRIFGAYNELYDIAYSPERNGYILLAELKEWIVEKEANYSD